MNTNQQSGADTRSLSMRIADKCRCGNCGHEFALGRGLSARLGGELYLVCPECLRDDSITTEARS